MPKFFVDASAIRDGEVLLEGIDVNHIKNVLRLPIGAKIVINDRQGTDYQCIIATINHDRISAHIESYDVSTSEPSTKVVLFQSLIKGEKMDFLLQKAVEIGVTEIVPIATSRCVVKIEKEKKEQAKLERWNKIAEAAAKQSGRGVVPKVLAPMRFEKALDLAVEELSCNAIPYEKEKTLDIKSFLQQEAPTSIGIFIGPEGGFTEEEIAMALAKNIKPVTLGPRILRSETASLVMLTNVMYEMGEMR